MGSEGRGGDIQVTNDGATILRSVGVDNPAAKVLVDISKVQDQEVGFYFILLRKFEVIVTCFSSFFVEYFSKFAVKSPENP